jgi:hypothetical protein
VQSTPPPQASSPQVTVQLPAPQTTDSLQLCSPVHSMTQFVAALQSTI